MVMKLKLLKILDILCVITYIDFLFICNTIIYCLPADFIFMGESCDTLAQFYSLLNFFFVLRFKGRRSSALRVGITLFRLSYTLSLTL